MRLECRELGAEGEGAIGAVLVRPAAPSKSAGETGMTLLRRFAEAEEAGRKLGVAGPPKSAAESRYCWERRCGAR